MVGIYFKIITLIFLCSCLYACNYYKNAKQTTAMTEEFAVEGKVVHAEIEAIKKRAQEVDCTKGINEGAARVLVEKYLLDRYPQWLGWQIEVRDNGYRWETICSFAGTSKILNVDKKTGLIQELAEKSNRQFPKLEANVPQYKSISTGQLKK